MPEIGVTEVVQTRCAASFFDPGMDPVKFRLSLRWQLCGATVYRRWHKSGWQVTLIA